MDVIWRERDGSVEHRIFRAGKMTCQCRFVRVTKASPYCRLLRVRKAVRGGRVGAGGGWELSVPPAQFFCEPKAALKIN